jgi:hypothetical protein
MKFNRTFIALTLLFTAAICCGPNGQAKQSPSVEEPFVGVWRGQMEGLPAVTLTISNEGGSLSGAALFYFQKRKSVDDPWTATPGLPEPLFNLRFDGKTLRFDVSHRRAHPPRTLSDPPFHFHLTLIGPNEAGLVNETESSLENKDPGPGLPMIRSDY